MEGEAALHSERGGIGLLPPEPGRVSAQAVAVDVRRSLAVNDKTILASFTLQAVLNQLVSQNGGTGFTSTQLFRQLWDTQNAAPGQADLNAVTASAHCTDNGGTLNGFTYACRPEEGAQASTSTTTTIASYSAIGLFNRFDLAPADGADCGEYRIVFAKTAGGGGRNFIIFEAVLPNPNPGLGLEGCRPVAQFWADLSSDADPASRTTKLHTFYFTGLPGFSPVLHIANYGNNVRGAGQVRTNQFIKPLWMLREFKLQRICPSTGCLIKFAPATVKVNPFGALFNPGNTSAQATDFQNRFVTQVASLALNDINRFNYVVPDSFNSGQSDSQTFGAVDDYVAQFGTGTHAFRTRIQSELTRLGSTLTPDEIVRRAQALSCAGCHQRSTSAPANGVGGGLVWPDSASFVHNSESTESDGSRFQLSPALLNTFLPFRKGVLEGFLNTPARSAEFVSQSVPTQVNAGTAFTATVTMKNTGTLAWTASNNVRLGSQSPQDNTTWGVNRVPLSSSDKVLQGQQKTFTLSLVAPSTPGTYTFQWQVLQESIARFGAVTPAVTITVVNPACAGKSGTGTYEGFLCNSNSQFIETRNIDCQSSFDNCVLNARNNPSTSFLCTWNGNVIYRRESTAGICNQVDCQTSTLPGSYTGYICDTNSAFIRTNNITCKAARDNCVLNASNNPSRSFYCEWNGRAIYRKEVTAGLCRAIASSTP
ncbi:NBR1-Ig-like domain-containing protein [Archangium violaceum]|uniref:NBR1-Ig-like domain-containing protein n=1 Tax=Archangium violaceum TaxID=83451 RepID=UPI0036DCA04E